MKIIHMGAPAAGHNGGKLDGWKQVFRACEEEKNLLESAEFAKPHESPRER